MPLIPALRRKKWEDQRVSIILSYYRVSSRTSLGFHKDLSKKKNGEKKSKEERKNEGGSRQTDKHRADTILMLFYSTYPKPR